MNFKHVEDLLLEYSKFGVELEEVNTPIIKISVPKDSYIKDKNNNPICGESLAKEFSENAVKTFGTETKGLKPKVLFKIRDEYWDKILEEKLVMKYMIAAIETKKFRNNL
jgi:hypothetical protein